MGKRDAGRRCCAGKITAIENTPLHFHFVVERFRRYRYVKIRVLLFTGNPYKPLPLRERVRVKGFFRDAHTLLL